jgi:Na+-driven multidrug efflux pump
MGVLGAAWAKNVCDFILALMLYLFITFKSPTPKTWIEWDKRAFDNILRNLTRAIKNGLTSYLEEFAFLILTFISVYT